MKKLLKTSCGVLAGVTALALTQVAPADAAARRTISGSKPTWVSGARQIDRVPKASVVSFTVQLAPRGGLASLKDAVASVSDPKSSSYRSFLTARQYHARYDPTDADVAQLSSWLRSRHLDVTKVESHHRSVSVRGTAAQVQSALKVKLNRYERDGRTVQANASPVTVPASVAPLVMGISGLDTTPHLMKHDAAPPPDAFVNARPCSSSYGQLTANRQADFKTPLPTFRGKTLPYAVCGYTGPQFRGAYEHGLSDELDGSGVTVAITDAYASPTIAKDAKKYAGLHGDGSYAKGQLSQVVPSAFTNEEDCEPSGWYGEETLDVEAVHAMAPGAKIRYYASSSCYDDDFLTTLAKVVDQNKAQLVSNSWGDLEQNQASDSVNAYETVFLQGALQGISFMFSSGDNGDELANTGLKQTDYPVSDPYVTAVGGTADAIGADGRFEFQTGWGTKRFALDDDGSSWAAGTYSYGAGGGLSSLFNQPSYQHGVVPGAFATARAVPDVALDADPTTGMLVGQTQTFPDGVRYGEYRIGGTSLASPLFAGMTALALQQAGGRLGLLNPAIYSRAGTPSFSDIAGSPPDRGNVRADYVNGLDASEGLLYSVRSFNQDSSLKVAKGWDPVTGVGSPTPRWVSDTVARP